MQKYPNIFFPFLIYFTAICFSQQITEVPAAVNDKFLSGELYRFIANKEQNKLSKTNSSEEMQSFILYFKDFPSEQEIEELEVSGITIYKNTWTPPVMNHPLGFVLAAAPGSSVNAMTECNAVVKIGLETELNHPLTNLTAQAIKSLEAKSQGYTGAGVKIAVLDSGFDTEPFNSNFSSNIVKKDYSNYPVSIDDDVENRVSGHGTHVAGIIGASGFSSEGNTINGGGKYEGISSSSELILLKIGNDNNGGATTNSIVGALDAAVNIYEADIINLSYGSWDTYHDGSSPKDQKIDWCYENGVSVFVAAGNEGASGRHFSGIVSANDSSDFIELNINNAAANEVYLGFNMVWQDGSERSDMFLKYYNASLNPVKELITYAATESTRGTESKISFCYLPVPAGNSVYYLKVINKSSLTNKFHLYEHYANGKVKFRNADPGYTIISPAIADYAFAVGSYNLRDIYTNSFFDKINILSGNEGDISMFSSRGPRIDGLQKPDIAAPGSAIISLRDRDVYSQVSSNWIDNDGVENGESDYIVMQGTSMASPVCAAAAALIISNSKNLSSGDIYEILRNSAAKDEFTGNENNPTFGYGKLDVLNSVNFMIAEGIASPLPVELINLSAESNGGNVTINWQTATEVNNYGFEVERSTVKGEWLKVGFVEGAGNSNSPKEYSFTDNNLTLTSYFYSYRLKQIDLDGSFTYSIEVKVNSGEKASEFKLEQNYPNPFNPTTTIKYSIPTTHSSPVPLHVSLVVYNLLGQEVTTLVNEQKPVGNYEVKFDASNLSSGVYLYNLQAGSYNKTMKMNLLK